MLLAAPLLAAGYIAVTYAVSAPPAVGPGTDGEVALAAASFGIPHPSGAPLHVAALRVLGAVPLAADPAARFTLLSAAFSAGCAMLVYAGARLLIARAAARTALPHAGILAHGGATVAALTLAFSNPFWAQALRCDAANFSLLLLGCGLLAALSWATDPGPTDWRLPMIAAYVAGLAGAMDAAMLAAAAPAAGLLAARTGSTAGRRAASAASAAAAVLLAAWSGLPLSLLPALATRIPSAHAAPVLLLLLLAFAIALLGAGMLRFLARPSPRVLPAVLCGELFLLGASSVLVIPIRGAQHPAAAYGDPATVAGFVRYLRDGGAGEPARLRGSAGASMPRAIEAGFLLPVLHAFAGRASAAPGAVVAPVPGLAADADAGARHYYGLPLLLALAGLYACTRVFPGAGWYLLALFLLCGAWHALAASPRGGVNGGARAPLAALLPLATLAGLGAAALLGAVLRARPNGGSARVAAATLLLLAVPLAMLRANRSDNNRSGDTLARDYAALLLRGCDSAALLVTEGDDDTWPALYLQRAQGVRTDVAIVPRGESFAVIERARRARPVYVSVAVPPDVLPLERSALRLEGLAYRWTPPGASLRKALRHDALAALLAGAPALRGPAGGVAGVVAGAAPYVANLRAAHLRLAEYQLRVRGDAAAARATLAAMERRYPRGAHPLPHRTAYEEALLLRDAGAPAAAAALLRAAAEGARRGLRAGGAADARQALRLDHPYRTLLDVAVARGRRADALAVLDDMRRAWPNAPDVRARRRALERESTRQQ